MARVQTVGTAKRLALAAASLLAVVTVLDAGGPVEPTAGGEPAGPVVSIAGAPVRGAPDAPLTIIEYSDYQ
ncbi:MAG TPA: hypothetical protein VNO23_08715 [Candidatus Binatia bacterium]|nr:hypothetical protein [Candidatus Binatia bacterium]